MAEELARWIAESGQRATDRAALQAIALFAGESATMRLARDDVRTLWFPPGTCVIEQGEPADALYLILTGTAMPCGSIPAARSSTCGECRPVTSSASMAWWRARERRTW